MPASVALCNPQQGRGGTEPQKGATMKRKPVQTNVTRPDRPPDCVTVTRIGDTVLTVRGYCDPTAGETAEGKLVKIIKKEAARECGNTFFTDTG